MYRLFLSARFLLHHWLMTLIGSFFVGASLVVLVVVMSVMDGFQYRLKETYAGSSADLTVTPRYPADLGALEEEIRRVVPGVAGAGPLLETVSLIRREGKVDPGEEEFHFAVVFGVDGRKEARVNRWQQNLLHPETRQPTVRDLTEPFQVHDELERLSGTKGVIVGRDLLRKTLRLRVGQKIRLFTVRPVTGEEGSPGSGGSALEDYELRDGLFQVVGTYATGNSEIDSRAVFLDYRDVREFFSSETCRSSVRFRLDDPDGYREAREAIQRNLMQVIRRSVLPGERATASLLVSNWQEQNRALVDAIESEKRMILVISFLIVVAGASSIFAAQWLLVSDKIREIGILRALGAGVPGVTAIFVSNGFLMGVLGSAGGTGVGLLVVRYIDTVHEGLSHVMGHKVFDPTIYLFDKIPTRVDSEQVAQYAVAALVCTLLASAVPALRAGMMDPAKALRRD